MVSDTIIERILRDYDNGGDRGRSYKEYYTDVFEPCYERNCFDNEEKEEE
ncbi:MAG: hypothetical protein ABIC57_04000 [bacterium]